jgi:hypothetical protein
MGSLNKYSRRDYINNSKWQNKNHDKFERILELYNYETRLENKHKSTSIKEKRLLINKIAELINKYNNNFDFDIPPGLFKRLYRSINKIEWFTHSENINYWYTLEKNKRGNLQIWIKSEININNNNNFNLFGGNYAYNMYDQIFNNLTLLSKLKDLKICYNQLFSLNKYSIMEQPIKMLDDFIW